MILVWLIHIVDTDQFGSMQDLGSNSSSMISMHLPLFLSISLSSRVYLRLFLPISLSFFLFASLFASLLESNCRLLQLFGQVPLAALPVHQRCHEPKKKEQLEKFLKFQQFTFPLLSMTCRASSESSALLQLTMYSLATFSIVQMVYFRDLLLQTGHNNTS